MTKSSNGLFEFSRLFQTTRDVQLCDQTPENGKTCCQALGTYNFYFMNTVIVIIIIPTPAFTYIQIYFVSFVASNTEVLSNSSNYQRLKIKSY